MANKTIPTKKSVDKFLENITPEQKKKDSKEIVKMMQKITGEKPVMWGSIIGFGKYHYKYASGREGEWMKTGFAPRKQNISFYLSCDLSEVASLLGKLGKHKTGVGCLYINKLADVDKTVLKEIIEKSATRETK